MSSVSFSIISLSYELYIAFLMILRKSKTKGCNLLLTTLPKNQRIKIYNHRIRPNLFNHFLFIQLVLAHATVFYHSTFCLSTSQTVTKKSNMQIGFIQAIIISARVAFEYYADCGFCEIINSIFLANVQKKIHNSLI